MVDRLQTDAKERLDAAVAAGQEALRTGEGAAIRTALDELNVAYSAAGASLYQNATTSDAPPADGSAPADAPKDDTVEADYEIVDEAPKS